MGASWIDFWLAGWSGGGPATPDSILALALDAPHPAVAAAVEFDAPQPSASGFDRPGGSY